MWLCHSQCQKCRLSTAIACERKSESTLSFCSNGRNILIACAIQFRCEWMMTDVRIYEYMHFSIIIIIIIISIVNFPQEIHAHITSNKMCNVSNLMHVAYNHCYCAVAIAATIVGLLFNLSFCTLGLWWRI